MFVFNRYCDCNRYASFFPTINDLILNNSEMKNQKSGECMNWFSNLAVDTALNNRTTSDMRLPRPMKTVYGSDFQS